MVHISFVRKNKHTDNQRNKHTFKKKDKKQTETETKLETISKFLVGPIHFQGETKNKKTKDKR